MKNYRTPAASGIIHVPFDLAIIELFCPGTHKA